VISDPLIENQNTFIFSINFNHRLSRLEKWLMTWYRKAFHDDTKMNLKRPFEFVLADNQIQST